jgi:hypothetical protein
MKRNGDWMTTFSGRMFWPADPLPEDIFIEDVAHHLSLLCRYTGAVRKHFSVAQHSVMVSEIVPDEDALWGLLHDAAEAYLNDLNRPVKVQLASYRDMECRLLKAVADRFGLPWPMPESIHHADLVLLATERRDLLNHGNHVWDCIRGIDALTGPIVSWQPVVAEHAFLTRYKELVQQ